MAKKLNEIHRTATFAWSPGQQLPLIAAGTASGTLDDSFSNASELELFQLDLRNSTANEGLSPVGKVSTNARFNTLGWGYANAEKPHGIIAGGMETGELELWNPAAILEKKSPEEALILRNSTHTGPLRGLDFNKIQPNLLASAGANGEVYVWDLTNPGKPYSPGQRSSKLDDITSAAWNCQVQHILATSSANGYTVVWDLRNRKEIMTLAGQGIGGMAGGRRGIGAIAWHPDVATQIVTASEDDNNPVITLWDLRHAHSPEKTLAGHSKGVMGVSWCQQDSDLLLSCGKDCKTLCWNPRSGELLGEVSQSTNWTFDVDWCPKNPDLLACASFDGKINVYSIQGAGSHSASTTAAETTPAYADDPFSAAIMAAQPPSQSFALKQPPKWLRRPVGASFAFGGKLVSFNNKGGQAAAQVAANMPPGAAPAPQTIPCKVTVVTVVVDPEIVKRSNELESAIDQQALEKLIEERSQQCANAKDADNLQNWEVLRTLFAENAREQLMQHLGFRKEEATGTEPSAAKENVTVTTATAEATVEEQSQKEAPAAESEQAPVEPVTNGAVEQETATATESTTPSAAVSAIPEESLELYPEGSSETDKSITKAIVMGDFETAVQLSLSSDRLSDALLLAICGGSDLLARTQKQYFERQAKKTSYLRLLQSIVDQDLNAVVRNTALEEWTSVVVMLCTFARTEDFGPLCETLGDRLQDAWNSAVKDRQADKANELRRNATLCYLAAGNMEKVANIWIIEQEEGKSKEDKDELYAISLQNLIEKVTVFRKAIEFVDPGLSGEHQESYQLARLYDKYCEYAELMATQGKLDVARRYLELTPSNYRESAADRLSDVRQRVYIASGHGGELKAPEFPIASSAPAAEPAAPAAPAATAFQQTGYTPEPATFQQHGYSQQYTPMAPNAYEPAPAAAPAPAPVPAVPTIPQPTQQYGYDRQYMPSGATIPQPPQPYGYDAQYGAPPMGAAAAPPPPPPKGRGSGTSSPAVSHRAAATTGAWNDPPNIANPNVTKSPAAAPVAPRRVTSPFPNMPAPSTFAPAPPQPFMQQNVAQPPPPPPMNAVPPPPMMRQQQQQQVPPPPPAAQQPPPPPMGYVPQQPQQMPQPTGYSPQQQQVPPQPVNAPPPPGGHASPRASPAPPRVASPAPAKPAVPPAAPEKKRHPKDDRSHIPPEHRPIHQILVNELQQAKQRSPPAQKKILDDTERRFNTLFDQLNNGEVSEGVAQAMLSLVQALQKRDYDTAQRIHVDLVTTRYEECGSWLMGVKRLIDNAKATA